MPRLLLISLAIITVLLGLIFGLCYAATMRSGLPPVIALSAAGSVALVTVLFQFLIGPILIDWIMRIEWYGPSVVDSQFADWMRKTCAMMKIPEPKFGVIEDGSPNAFTYGNGAFNARVVVTRGCIDALSPEELRAVVAHELGHIKHRDFIVMTAVQALVLAIQIFARGTRGHSNIATTVFGTLAYYISYYISLMLSRVREYMADYASAQVTGDPNSLSRALVKIAYGLATTHVAGQGPSTNTGFASSLPAWRTNPTSPQAAPASFQQSSVSQPTGPKHRAPLKPIVLGQSQPQPQAQTQPAQPQSPRLQPKQPSDQDFFAYLNGQKSPAQGLFSNAKSPLGKKPALGTISSSGTGFGAMGIAGIHGVHNAVCYMGSSGSLDPLQVARVARWELYNPWAKLAEFMSTHPLSAKRILALQKLNRRFGKADEFDFNAVPPAKYRRFFLDAVLIALPFALGFGAAYLAFLSGWGQGGNVLMVGLAGYCAGAFVKNLASYPLTHRPSSVAALLEAVDVSPVNPIPIAVEGVLTGKLDAGLPWADDMILQDHSGFVPVQIRHILGVAEAVWGWTESDRYIGQRVRVEGWYRRFGAPVIEVRSIVGLDNPTLRTGASWWWFSIGCGIAGTVLFGVLAFVLR